MTRSQIFKLANIKMQRGVKKYGRYNPKTDKRNLYDEMISEHIDIINYNIMQIQKINLMKEKRWKTLS